MSVTRINNRKRKEVIVDLRSKSEFNSNTPIAANNKKELNGDISQAVTDKLYGKKK